jgi:ribosomal protein S12 methylthiotransferase
MERPLVKTVHFVSLGCAKNRVDSEVMLGLLGRGGYEVVAEPERASVIVVNSCSFIGEAKQESIDTILEMASYKTDGACTKLVVTGCLSQRYADQLASELPEVDHFLGSADFARLPEVLEPARGAPAPRLVVAGTPEYLYDDQSPRRLSTVAGSAYLKIAEGCDRPCAFCIIPALRGPQRSRTIDSVVREAEQLVASGVVELNLVAQDLTKYGDDLAAGEDQPRLAALLRRLARVAGLRWIRLHYAYPSALTDELIEVIAQEPTLCSYVDVPIQHIDDEVLKRMRRGYGAKLVRERIERLRSRVPDVVLRTTFIVGHPGETEAAFGALCDFVREAEFDRVGVFRYSREDGTVSALLPGRVEAVDVRKRHTELMKLQRTISRRRQRRWAGQELEVLVEGPSEESDLLWEGRHWGQAPEIDGKTYLALDTGIPAPQPGQLVRARVTRTSDYDLAATIVGVEAIPSVAPAA